VKLAFAVLMLALLMLVLPTTRPSAASTPIAANLSRHFHEALRSQLALASPARHHAILETLLGARGFATEIPSELRLSEALRLIEQAETRLTDGERAAYARERARILRQRLVALKSGKAREKRSLKHVQSPNLPLKLLLATDAPAFAYSQDGRRLVLASSGESSFAVHDLVTPGPPREVPLSHWAPALDVSPNGRYVLSKQVLRQFIYLSIHDLESGQAILPLRKSPSGQVRFLPGSGQALNSSFEENQFIRLTDGAGKRPSRAKIQPIGPGLLAQAPNAGPFARLYLDPQNTPTLELRSDLDGSLLGTVSLPGADLDVFARGALSPDGRWLALATAAFKVQVFEVASGKLVHTASLGLTDYAAELTFSGDGKSLAVIGRRDGLNVFHVTFDAGGPRLQSAEIHDFRIDGEKSSSVHLENLRLSPDGRKYRLRHANGIHELDPQEIP
jgi:WD40 repeat protein